MLGYGVGIQVPVKIGDAAIESARNYKDTRSWGKNSYIRTKRDSGRTASLTEAARTFLLRGAVYYAAIALAWPHPGFGQFSPCSARFREALARAVEQDRVREADSLYTAYESLCL